MATASYGRAGGLRVWLEPDEAVAAGAAWRRKGASGWRESGDTEEGVPAGGLTVQFKSLEGWTAPLERRVDISAGNVTVVTACCDPATMVMVAVVSVETGSLRRVAVAAPLVVCAMLGEMIPRVVVKTTGVPSSTGLLLPSRTVAVTTEVLTPSPCISIGVRVTNRLAIVPPATKSTVTVAVSVAT